MVRVGQSQWICVNGSTFSEKHFQTLKAMNDQDILGEIDRGVLGAADSLPALLDSVESGEAVEPRRLTFARRAAATVTKVADLLAIATILFGMAGGEYCRVCRIHYRNLGRIIIALCPRHSNMRISQFRERYHGRPQGLATDSCWTICPECMGTHARSRVLCVRWRSVG